MEPEPLDDRVASTPAPRSSSGNPVTIFPISSLPPSSTDSSTFISGVIALLIPYSTTTHTFRLILAEEDPQLRANQGQLRVSFHGKAAKEIASRDVQIGDKLVLGLEGGGWHKLKNVKEGRDLGWSLKFEGGLKGWVKGVEVKVEVEQGNSEVLVDGDESRSGRRVSPAGSELSTGSQSEWKLPTGSKGKRREYTPAGGDVRGLFDDEEELLREMESEGKEQAEPVRKKPRFSMGKYKVIWGDEEDQPSSETNRASSVAEDSQRERSVDATSEQDRMDETSDSRAGMPPPSIPSIFASFEDTDQQQSQYQEPPDSPSLKPVDSSGLPLISPLEHRGLSFSDYMMGSSTTATSDGGFSGLRGPLAHEEMVGMMKVDPEITISRPQSAGYDSTGPNSLFDSPLSPSPDPEIRSRGRSPAVQPSPLRNVHTVRAELQKGVGAREDWEEKAPLLLPRKAMSTRAVPEDTLPEEDNEGEGKSDANREEGMMQEGGDKQDEENNLMSVTRSTTRNLDDLLTRRTSQSTTRAQSHNVPSSTSTGGFQSGITTTLSDFPPLSHLTWGHVQDFIGVVCRTKPTERAKRGQRDYFMSMRVVDSSRPLGITVSVFRPREEALPRVDVGDCVLLRNFKIISQERRLMAISTDICAYAVWKDYGREKDAVVSGPPVEWEEEEEEYVRRIGAWFEGLDEEVRGDLGKWPGKKGKERAGGSGGGGG